MDGPVLSSDSELSRSLESQRWLFRRHPFPHYWARNVFTAEAYSAIETAFNALLTRGLSEKPDKKRLARKISGYDAYSANYGPETATIFAPFITRAWHDMVANLFDVKPTYDVDIGLHHHPVGSKTGWIHNDLNPGWFVDAPRSDGINLSNSDLCDYHHGTRTADGVIPRETVRAVAMIFYLANPVWTTGDGGETGFYANAKDPVESPAATIPPHNNSLVMFECTPYSHHTFLTNRRHPRNNLVWWLHRPKAEVQARWGDKAIVYWKKKKPKT